MTDITGVGSLDAVTSLRTGTADAVQNSAFARGSAQISAATARLVIAASKGGGNAILELLEDMRSVVFAADNAGRLSGAPSSRLTHQAQINQFLAQIDRIATGAGVGSINLLSPDAPSVRFRTTAFGGSFEVSPKPLDTGSLLLTGLAVVSDADIRNAFARLSTAITRASTRMIQIDALVQVFSAGTSFLDQLTGTADRSPGGQINLLG